MRRGTSLLAVIVTVGLLAAPPAAAADENYVIATSVDDCAPFEYLIDDGHLVGIDLDLMTAIAEDQGFGITWRRLPFEDTLQLVQDGEADGVIAALVASGERMAAFDFSDPYIETGPQMAVLQTTDGIATYEDLRGKQVAVSKDSESADFLHSVQDSYGFSIAYLDHDLAVFEDVRNGNSQALFMDSAYLNFEIAYGNGFKTVTGREGGAPYHFAVKKSRNAELLRMFNAGLHNLKESGRYDEIVDRYVGQRATLDDYPFWVQLIVKLIEKLWPFALLLILLTIFVVVTKIGARINARKDAQDDPEARIRELGRSLDDRGQTRG